MWTIRFQGEQTGDYALGVQATIPTPADEDDAQRFHFRLPAIVPAGHRALVGRVGGRGEHGHGNPLRHGAARARRTPSTRPRWRATSPGGG